MSRCYPFLVIIGIIVLGSSINVGCTPFRVKTHEYVILAKGDKMSALFLQKGGYRVMPISPEGSYPSWSAYNDLLLHEDKSKSSDEVRIYLVPDSVIDKTDYIKSGEIRINETKNEVIVIAKKGRRTFNGTHKINLIVPLVDIESIIGRNTRVALSGVELFERATSEERQEAGIHKRDILLSYLCSDLRSEMNYNQKIRELLYETPIAYLYLGVEGVSTIPVVKFNSTQIEMLRAALKQQKQQAEEQQAW